MSREFLRKSLQKEGSSLGPNASGAERHMALVNRLYASYEKVGSSGRRRSSGGCLCGDGISPSRCAPGLQTDAGVVQPPLLSCPACGEGVGLTWVVCLYCVCACALLLLPQLQNKLSEARSTLQNSIDPNTGKRLFHPETGRAPRFSRNISQQPVSEYLYSLSQQQVRAMQTRRFCSIGMWLGSNRGQDPNSQAAHAEGWQAVHGAQRHWGSRQCMLASMGADRFDASFALFI